MKARGQRIARARKRQGLSQQALADRVSTHRTTVVRIELGDHSPSVDVALAICAQLGESVESLFGG
jgi:putative transcriptional regulator